MSLVTSTAEINRHTEVGNGKIRMQRSPHYVEDRRERRRILSEDRRCFFRDETVVREVAVQQAQHDRLHAEVGNGNRRGVHLAGR